MHHLLHDTPRRLGANLALALRAVRHGQSREEQLHVVVDFRHGADGRTRALHVVRLLDCDGGWDASDFVHARLVHAVEELPRVGRKRLHVAPLPLGIHGIKSEGAFAGAARAGDDDQLTEWQIEVEPLQIILPCAKNLNAAGGWRDGESGSFFWHRQNGRALSR